MTGGGGAAAQPASGDAVPSEHVFGATQRSRTAQDGAEPEPEQQHSSFVHVCPPHVAAPEEEEVDELLLEVVGSQTPWPLHFPPVHSVPDVSKSGYVHMLPAHTPGDE